MRQAAEWETMVSVSYLTLERHDERSPGRAPLHGHIPVAAAAAVADGSARMRGCQYWAPAMQSGALTLGGCIAGVDFFAVLTGAPSSTTAPADDGERRNGRRSRDGWPARRGALEAVGRGEEERRGREGMSVSSPESPPFIHTSLDPVRT